MSRLTSTDLFNEVEAALRLSELNARVLQSQKPFRFEVTDSNGLVRFIRVYIWTCTHGGGAARADDEYRIQFTGVVPESAASENTLLLGWHEVTGVFAAWDINFHDGQNSSSPSAQIREEILMAASLNGIAFGVRGNGERVAAFRPELFGRYIEEMGPIHFSGR